jgi:hypothetical protein
MADGVVLMKSAEDKKTPDLLGDTCDLAGPVPAKPSTRELAAARAARFKERHGVQAVTILLPADQVAAFNRYIEAKNAKLTKENRISKSGVIGKLIESQLLRKR